MQKLGIIREDISPVEETSNDKVAFECDNVYTGEASMIERSEDKIDKGAQKLESLPSKS
jgi:hypothetical protein